MGALPGRAASPPGIKGLWAIYWTSCADHGSRTLRASGRWMESKTTGDKRTCSCPGSGAEFWKLLSCTLTNTPLPVPYPFSLADSIIPDKASLKGSA